MIHVAPHQDHFRLGVDERGHGLSMRTLRDNGCCAEWASGEASSLARAEAFREVAARWGSTWPKAQPEAAGPEPEPKAEL